MVHEKQVVVGGLYRIVSYRAFSAFSMGIDEVVLMVIIR
jgi:hypothetical protein